MIIDHRTYTLVAGGAPRWIELYKLHGLEPQRRILPKLIGYFTTEIGPLNQIIHLWGYEDLAQRAERRATLAADPAWRIFVDKALPLIVHQENKLLLPADFSP